MDNDVTSSGISARSQLPRPRLVQPSPDRFTPEQDILYGKVSTGPYAHKTIDRDGSVLGPGVLTLIRPDLNPSLMASARAFRTEQFISARAREIVVLVTARGWRSEFVWHAHAEEGREVGVTEAEILAVYTGERLTLPDPVDHAAYEMACALVAHSDLNDDEFRVASAVLSPEQLIEVSMLVGKYAQIALNLRVYRIGLPSGVEPYFVDADEG